MSHINDCVHCRDFGKFEKHSDHSPFREETIMSTTTDLTASPEAISAATARLTEVLEKVAAAPAATRTFSIPVDDEGFLLVASDFSPSNLLYEVLGTLGFSLNGVKA